NGVGMLVGGFGISGDGVDQDDVVTFAGAVGFNVPPRVLRADETTVGGVRLPYQKFNRKPMLGEARPRVAGDYRSPRAFARGLLSFPGASSPPFTGAQAKAEEAPKAASPALRRKECHDQNLGSLGRPVAAGAARCRRNAMRTYSMPALACA